jgi:hypothetical protein
MGDPLKKVQPGQRMQIPAEAYNAFIDAAQAHKSRRHDLEQGTGLALPQPGLIKIRNATGDDCERYAILALNSPLIAPANNLAQFKNQVAFNGTLPVNPVSSARYAILAEPLSTGAIGRALLASPTPVRLQVISSAHQYASPVHLEAQFLRSDQTGLYRILWKESGTGLKWAVVMAEPKEASDGSTPAVVFQLTTALAAGVNQTATATVTTTSDIVNYPAGAPITVYNTGQMVGHIGAQGVAIQFAGVWWVVDLNQPTVLAYFTFTGATHGDVAGGAFGSVSAQVAITFSGFTSLTPYPLAGTPTAAIANPYNLVALSGDFGLCTRNLSTGQYQLIAVHPPKARRFYFKLTADWPNGLQQTSTYATALYPDPINQGGDLNYGTGAITLFDRWDVAHNAKGNDVGLCQLNYSNNQFDIVQIEHIFTKGRGTVTSAFSGTPDTFSVTDVEGFDGRVPVGTGLTIENELKIESAKANDLLELRWNPLTGKFYALPNGGAGSVIPVKLVQVGGAQGTATAAATWTYDVKDIQSDDTLASGVNPVSSPHQYKRPSVGQMIKATFGYAHRSGSGDLVLGWINEVADQETCQIGATP